MTLFNYLQERYYEHSSHPSHRIRRHPAAGPASKLWRRHQHLQLGPLNRRCSPNGERGSPFCYRSDFSAPSCGEVALPHSLLLRVGDRASLSYAVTVQVGSVLADPSVPGSERLWFSLAVGPRQQAPCRLIDTASTDRSPGARPPPTPPILSPRPARAVGSPALAADAVSREGFTIIRVLPTSGFSCRHDDRLTSDPCSSRGGRWRCVGSDLLCGRYGHMCRAYAYMAGQCLSPHADDHG